MLFHPHNGWIPSFLLSFLSFQGTVLQGFDPTPEELCCCFQRVKEEAVWASSTIAEARISSWMWYPTATWYMQFLPQSQANPEFITISWALNKLTPSLCQDSVRAEQFAFRTSTDVSSPLQFSVGRNQIRTPQIAPNSNSLHLFPWTVLKTNMKIVNGSFNKSWY